MSWSIDPRRHRDGGTHDDPAADAALMLAVVRDRYGPPDVLELREVDRPETGEDEILVRVRAASVNAVDWHLLRGEPLPARFAEGVRRPRTRILGVDMAGEVEAVGRAVTAFRPGDAVMGNPGRTFAEYTSGKVHGFVAKPAHLTFEQAAAVPVAGLTSLQGLRDKGRLRPGESVLINGASGGVGTFAVQIAKVLGAEVTAVCSTGNVEQARSLGASQVIDYTQADFTRSGARYDLVFDVAGSRPLRSCRRVVAPAGRLVVVGGPGGRWIRPADRMAAAAVLSRIGSVRMLPFLSKHSHPDLATLRDMVESGAVVPIVDRTYPLARAPEAVRYVEGGHARAKVVITV